MKRQSLLLMLLLLVFADRMAGQTCSLISPPPTLNQSICEGFSISTITFNLGDVNNVWINPVLPPGIFFNYNTETNIINIDGTTFTAGSTVYSIMYDEGSCTNAFTITINALPTANAGSDLTICQGGITAGLAGWVGGSATGGTWTSNAGGTFIPNPNDLNANWTPDPGFSGPATLTLTTFNPGGCPDATSSRVVTVNAIPSITPMNNMAGSGQFYSIEPEDGPNGSVPAGTLYSWGPPSLEPGLTIISGEFGTDQASISGFIQNSTSIPRTATFTITPSNQGCTGTNFTLTVNVYPAVTITSKTTTTCSHVPFSVLPVDGIDGDIVPPGTTYSWDAPVSPNTGGVGEVNQPDIHGTLTNNTNVLQTAIYTVIPRYNSTDYPSFTVNVNVDPEPDLATATTPVCSDSPINVTLTDSRFLTSLFDLLSITADAGLVPGGGNVAAPAFYVGSSHIANDTWTNKTTNTLTVTYRVVPNNSVGCSGFAEDIVVNIKPEPDISNNSSVICSDTPTGYLLDIYNPGEVGSITYYINSINSNGLMDSDGTNVTWISGGSNLITNEKWTNKTLSDEIVTYFITPTGNGCIGDMEPITITIKPEPDLSNLNAFVCSDVGSGLMLSIANPGAVGSVTYFINTINPNGLTESDGTLLGPGSSGGSFLISNERWTNKTSSDVNVVYSIFPTGSNGCPGDPEPITLTIEPAPDISTNNITTCSDAPVGLALNISNPGAVGPVTYTINSINTNGLTDSDGFILGPGSSGGSNLLFNEKWINKTNSDVDIIYLIIPQGSNGCQGTPETVRLSVKPGPDISTNNAMACSNIASGLTLGIANPGSVGAVTYTIISINTNGLTEADGTILGPGSSGGNNLIFNEKWTNNTASDIDVLYSISPGGSNGCTGEIELITVTVRPGPATPIIGTITEPTCTVSTGSVFMSGLPAGNWIINPGGIPGSTSTTTISGLDAGSYNFTVTNATGCISAASGNVNILPQPSTPPAPAIGTITQPTCALSTGTVDLTGLPSGNWIINPGNIAGSTATKTISGLIAGTYNYTVTNAAGCTSVLSGNVVIDVQPATPPAPTATPDIICYGMDGGLEVTSVPVGTIEWWSDPGCTNLLGSGIGFIPSTIPAVGIHNYWVTDRSITTMCKSLPSAVTLTVHPLPATTITGPTTVCLGSTLTYSTETGMSNYQWTGDGIHLSFLEPPYQTAKVTFHSPGTGWLRVRNSDANCANETTVNVNILQYPVINSLTATICSGGTFSITPVNGTDGTIPSGTGYSWSAPSVTGINGAAAGTGVASISGTLTNTTSSAKTVVYTVVPLSTGCSGPSFNVTVTVNPVPSISSTSTLICSGSTFSFTPSDAVSGVVPAETVYSWALPVGGGFTGGKAGISENGISGTLSNSTNTLLSAIYTITPVSGSCTGAPFNLTTSINPKPAINTISSESCSGTTFDITPANGTDGIVPAGTTFIWGTPAGTGFTGGASASSASSINGTLLNTTNTVQSATYTVTPVWGGCAGEPFLVKVSLNPGPVVNQLSKSVCSGEPFSLSPVSGTDGIIPSGTTYSWASPSGTGFSGGAPGSGASLISGNLTNSTIVVQTAAYTITPVNDGCIGLAFGLEVSVDPVPSSPTITSAGPLQLCLGDSVTLSTSDLPGFSYHWKRNGGDIGLDLNTYVAKTAGSYSLAVSNSYSCTANSLNTIQVADSNHKITTTFKINGPTLFCEGGSVVLSVTNNSAYTYQWLKDGAEIPGAGTYSYTAMSTGIYALNVLNSTGCKSKTEDVDVIVSNPPPAPVITAGGPLEFCQPDSVMLTVPYIADHKYQWKLNGSAAGTDHEIIAAKSSGTYSLVLSNSAGCSTNSVNTIPVTVNARPSEITLSVNGPLTFCQGNLVEMSVTNNPEYSYQWQKDGSEIAGAVKNSYSSMTPGVFALTVSNSKNCKTVTENIVLSVNESPDPPSISVSGPLQLCIGDSSVMSTENNPDYTYQWKMNGVTTGSGEYIMTAKSPGIYSLAVTNKAGCSATSVNSINIPDGNSQITTTFRINGSTSFCMGGNVEMSVSKNSSYTYQWQDRGANITGASSNVYSAGKSGIYSLLIRNPSGCLSRTEEVDITVKPVPVRPVLLSENYQEGQCQSDNPVKLKADAQVPGYTYQWLKNGAPVSNATLPYIEGYLDAGNYMLEAELDGCSIQSAPQTLSYHEAPLKPMIYVQGTNAWYLGCSNDSASQYRWYFNGNIIEGADRFIYFAGRKLGRYFVSIANPRGCFTSSDIVTIPTGVTGIIDESVFHNLKVYPNPSRGLFTIEMDNQLFGDLFISVINMEGRSIMKLTSEKKTTHFALPVDLGGQPGGIYFIVIKIGQVVSDVKIIKE